MSRRTEKIASLMQQEVASMIQRDINDPRLPAITSVTRVKVAEDLSTADVFVTIMGTPGEQTAGLNALRHAAGMMRGRLTREMNLRQAPYIKFHLDEQLKKEMALMDLLAKVRQEQEEKETAQNPAPESSDDAAAGAAQQQGDAESKDESRD